MSQHLTISPNEADDSTRYSRNSSRRMRIAPNRRDAKGRMALFTADHFVVHMNAKDPKPSQELNSEEELAPVFADLDKHAATMHFLGQSTILSLTRDAGTAEAYCLAHHLTVDGGKRSLMLRRSVTTHSGSRTGLGCFSNDCYTWIGPKSAFCHDGANTGGLDESMSVPTVGQENLVILGATGVRQFSPNPDPIWVW